MDRPRSVEESTDSPWMCHVCGASARGESHTCSACFRTVCPDHLRRVPMRSRQTGIYHLTALCVHCIAEKAIGLSAM